ncbi:outer membrane beta-barrel protein [Massilia sp. CF038]|uniref:outer membrane beta-barrel protein n=1 Tax=Massilia sp. CF038 TaxID=1881045 RepID=UPI0009108F50|nr:outer membrane beta-barrel protein [Massilia sp. CF038]SHH39050.1 Outer membrane protein beta-barrel domain-containing protein [Massilia sp. CF038]
MFKKFAIAATFAIASSAAMAADQPYFYAGLDAGSSKVEGADRETSYGAFAGYQINENFGIEAGYRRLADTTALGADLTVDQISLSGIGTIPLSNGFSVYGRLGYNRIGAEATIGNVSAKDHENKALYGIGLGYTFSPTVAGRLEVQKPDGDITNISAGVAFRF